MSAGAAGDGAALPALLSAAEQRPDQSLTRQRVHWSLGLLGPRSFAASDVVDPWWFETRCLVRPRPGHGNDLRLRGRLRFWHLAARDGDDETLRFVHLAARALRIFDFQFAVETAQTGDGDEQLAPFRFFGAVEDDGGTRPPRRYWPIAGQVRLGVAPAADAEPHYKVRLRVENLTAWASPSSSRALALRGALVSAHLLLSVPGGQFL